MAKTDDFNAAQYTTPIYLIPGGCPQFLDFDGSMAWLKDVQYAFEEEVIKVEGENKKFLHPFRPDAEDNFRDELDQKRIYRGRGYEIDGSEAIKPWLGQWLPLPFFRTRNQEWEGSKDARLEYGPSNWARGRLSIDEKNPERLHLVIAFDMEVDHKSSDIYAALRKVDVDQSGKFRLAWRLRDNAWFLDLPWLNAWVKEIWDNWKKTSAYGWEDDPYSFSHIANYLAYLECLQKITSHGFSNSEDNWVVELISPKANTIIDVDLVLDIGNSRTTGILVESVPGRPTRLKDGYLLQLRDMTKPEKIYAEPFDTRVEFRDMSFGNAALNKRSGRRRAAFTWPSPVRIGPEAARLATQSRSGTGTTGMSSPKRYLWDERDWKPTWRFNTGSADDPPVSKGPICQRINSSGTPLMFMADPAIAATKPFNRQEAKFPVFISEFTPSSLMMFLLIEIIHQALLTINSPAQRQRRGNRKDPRRLRQIIFTVPAIMPKAEQKIYKRWANWAVALLWDALGWEDYYAEPGDRRSPGMAPKYRDNHDGQNEENELRDYRESPVVRCEWDEATCTQLVYIFNEITCKFYGDAALFCEIMGREREFNGKLRPSVRIATIDIGGGTTDLSITTFELSSEPSSTPRMAPHPDFHDGFTLAGDDILHNIIRDQFFPALEQAFTKIGVSNTESALKTLFGPDLMDSREADRKKRAQFIHQIAVPAGLCLIDLYERSNYLENTDPVTFRLRDCFEREEDPSAKTSKKGQKREAQVGAAAALFAKTYPYPGEDALEYVNARLGEPDFDIMDVEVTMIPSEMTRVIEETLGHILKQLGEVIKLYDCDVLLLTGRPTRWDGIVNMIYSLVPVPPSRIMPMSRYIVDEWYPFRNVQNRITDPKTTVVVGAILCALAEGQLEGFSFDPRTLKTRSIARYIGEMEAKTAQIKEEKVWFTVKPDPDAEDAEDGIANPDSCIVEPEEYTITFSSPISIGFRQLEADRWTTNRYYYLNLTKDGEQYGGRELKITLKLNLTGDRRAKRGTEEPTEGEFIITAFEDPASGTTITRPGQIEKIIEARLQTLPRDGKFWMDSGEIQFK